MRAAQLVRIGDPDRAFRLCELPDPVPGPAEVVIDVEAFGLNFADVMARIGVYPDAPALPCVLGYEVVGRIAEAGVEVTCWRGGERVVAFTRFGGYATRAVTPATACARIPDEMDACEATMLPTQFGTAVFCAEEMVKLRPGDAVLVQAAAGGVGTGLVQLCKEAGCVVFGTASGAKIDHLNALGVDHPIDYRRDDFEEVVRSVVGARGLDVVFDSIGGSSVKKGRRLLGAGGRIVCFGAAQQAGPRRSVLRAANMAMRFGVHHPIDLMMSSQAVIGVNMLRIADDRPQWLARLLERTVELTAGGVLRPVVGGRFPAAELARAHEALGSRASIGKVACTW